MQVFQTLAHANEVDRHSRASAALAFTRPQGNSSQHTALGRAIEFGDDQAGQPQGLVKGLHLGQRVLAGVAVNHQQHLMGCGGVGFLHHPFDLFQLFHQMGLGRQAPSGIDNDHVLAPGFAGTDRIKGHGGRVAPRLADDVDPTAVGPDFELFACGRSEGVGGSQQHAGTTLAEVAGEFANAGGFASPIDTGDHDHAGMGLAQAQWFFQGQQQLAQQVFEQGLNFARLGDALGLDGLLQVLHQVLGGLHACIGHEQGRFQLFIQSGVDTRAGENAGQALSGAGQTFAQALQPAPSFRAGGGV